MLELEFVLAPALVVGCPLVVPPLALALVIDEAVLVGAILAIPPTPEIVVSDLTLPVVALELAVPAPPTASVPDALVGVEDNVVVGAAGTSATLPPNAVMVPIDSPDTDEAVKVWPRVGGMDAELRGVVHASSEREVGVRCAVTVAGRRMKAAVNMPTVKT